MMIFADKLIQLRKRNGWSQEELAEQMKVTRQSVSKWEGAQSVPDLGKMVQLSRLFGVSLDYLLKDEIEEEENTELYGKEKETDRAVRRVSMEEANGFLAAKALTAGKIAWATFLCIISPVALILLGAASETPVYGISENMAAGLGMITMLLLVAAAVAVYIFSGHVTESYEYLEKEIFETEYGVDGMVKERREQYRATYTKYNVIGACLCILAFVPLFGGLVFSEEDFFLAVMLAFMFFIAGLGVVFFIRGGIIWYSYDKLLQIGDYTREKKQRDPVVTAVSVSYWAVATAVYLACSFLADNWKESWIVWPIAGVLYMAVRVTAEAVSRRRRS